MHKLMALYKIPADEAAFFAHYNAVHLPLVDKIPGLVRTEVTKIDRTLMGDEGNFLLAELYFADADSFRKAMKSDENGAVGADAVAFAPGILTVMTGHTLGD
jgi:uncharacterized protein (TIGR02118 family)